MLNFYSLLSRKASHGHFIVPCQLNNLYIEMARYSSRGRPRSTDSYYDAPEDITRSMETYGGYDRPHGGGGGGIFDAIFHCTDFGRERYEDDYYDYEKYSRDQYNGPSRRRYYYDDDDGYRRRGYSPTRGRGYSRKKTRGYESESSYGSQSSTNETKIKKKDKKKSKAEKPDSRDEKEKKKKKSSSSKKDKDKKKDSKKKKRSKSTGKSGSDEKDARNDRVGPRREDNSELRETAPQTHDINDPSANGYFGIHQISQKMASMVLPNNIEQFQSSSNQSHGVISVPKTQSTQPTNTTSTGPSQRSYEPADSGVQYVPPSGQINVHSTHINHARNTPPTPMPHYTLQVPNHHNQLPPHSSMMRMQNEIPVPHENRDYRDPYPSVSHHHPPLKHEFYQTQPQPIMTHHVQQHPTDIHPPNGAQYQSHKQPKVPVDPEGKQMQQPPKSQKTQAAPQVPTIIRSDFDLSDTVSAITMMKPIATRDASNSARVSSSKRNDPDGVGPNRSSLPPGQRSSPVSLREQFREDGAMEAIIPPGDMSIVLSSSNNGLIVERISERSVARDLLQVGDVIVALDGVDVSFFIIIFFFSLESNLSGLRNPVLLYQISMFSAKVAAQLLHKRKQNRERTILYIPGNHQHIGMGQDMNTSRTGRGDYFDSQAMSGHNGHMDIGHHQYGYGY